MCSLSFNWRQLNAALVPQTLPNMFFILWLTVSTFGQLACHVAILNLIIQTKEASGRKMFTSADKKVFIRTAILIFFRVFYLLTHIGFPFAASNDLDFVIGYEVLKAINAGYDSVMIIVQLLGSINHIFYVKTHLRS
jgi:hypothetical protein